MALSAVPFGSVGAGAGAGAVAGMTMGGSVATVVVLGVLISGIAVPRISKAAAARAAGKVNPIDVWYSIAFWRMSVSVVAMGAVGAVGGAVVDAAA